MTVTINGTTGIDKVQPGVVTSSSLASGQTLAVNGIAFPATQSASSDANTLDDYEEGTFTPVVYATGSAPTISYSIQDGKYTRIGNVVYCRVGLSFNLTVSGSGNLLVSLPFISANLNNYYQHWPTGYTSSAVEQLYAIGVQWNVAQALLYQTVNGTGSNAAITGSRAMEVQFFYYVS